jgi:hypothetical protein
VALDRPLAESELQRDLRVAQASSHELEDLGLSFTQGIETGGYLFLGRKKGSDFDSRTDLGNPQRFRRYWLTVAAAIGVVWLSAIGLTLTIGDLLPAETPLTFAPIAILVGILVPKLHYQEARQAAIAAGLATLCGGSLPSGGGLLLGVVVGAFAPTLIARRST